MGLAFALGGGLLAAAVLCLAIVGPLLVRSRR